MRSFLLLPLLVASSVARADSTPVLDVTTVDPSCRALAEAPPSARTTGPAYDAAISTASCLVTARTQALGIDTTATTVLALDAAEAPAVRIFDRVIATGDAEHALIAQYAKVDMLVGNSARMFTALPRLSPAMAGAEVADYYRQVRTLDALTAPWRQRALDGRREIASIVRMHPQLASRDVVLARMIADSRIVEPAGVAAR